MVIDLTASTGKLIFDTTETGAGVEVFQPFEVAEGQLELISNDTVADGDTELTVQIANLSPGERVGFTIDVDDTLLSSELGRIRVTSSEISGGQVRLGDSTQALTMATFDDDSVATLSFECADGVS